MCVSGVTNCNLTSIVQTTADFILVFTPYLRPFCKDLFSIWQKIETNLVIFHCSKWPNVEQIIWPFDHAVFEVLFQHYWTVGTATDYLMIICQNSNMCIAHVLTLLTQCSYLNIRSNF